MYETLLQHLQLAFVFVFSKFQSTLICNGNAQHATCNMRQHTAVITEMRTVEPNGQPGLTAIVNKQPAAFCSVATAYGRCRLAGGGMQQQ